MNNPPKEMGSPSSPLSSLDGAETFRFCTPIAPHSAVPSGAEFSYSDRSFMPRGASHAMTHSIFSPSHPSCTPNHWTPNGLAATSPNPDGTRMTTKSTLYSAPYWTGLPRWTSVVSSPTRPWMPRLPPSNGKLPISENC
jgi:hypothetical protein